MKKQPKIVPFFSNDPDNYHCLQACVKSILGFYFPLKSFSDDEVNQRTGQIGGSTWLPPAITYLDELGLEVELYVPQDGFDYQSFAAHGMDYLRKKWGDQRFNNEERTGAFRNIDFVQKQSKNMTEKRLWKNVVLPDKQLEGEVQDSNVLAIGKTQYGWLSGSNSAGNAHFITIIKSYSATQWRVHDPGLPPKQNRIVPKSNNQGRSILFDIALIRGLK